MLKEFAKRLLIGTAIALAAGAARHAWPQGIPIGALPNATTPLTGAELTILSQNGITSKTTVNNLILPGLIIPNNTVLGNVSGTTQAAVAVTAGQLTTLLGIGTAAFQNIGTSGGTVPLLSGSNTWSGLQTFSGGVSIASLTISTLTVNTTLTGPIGAWTSGGLNSVPIGSTTAAAGKFTTLQATNNTVLVTTQITGLTTLQTATLTGFTSVQAPLTVTGNTILVTTQITGLTTLQTASLTGFTSAQAGLSVTGATSVQSLTATQNTVLVTTQITGLTSLQTATFTGFATLQGGLQVKTSAIGASLSTTTIAGLTTTQTTVLAPSTAGTLDNMVIGGVTPLAITGTTVDVSSLTASPGLLVGGTSSASTGPASNQTGIIQMNTTSTATGPVGGALMLNNWLGAVTTGNLIVMTKSRGSTVGTNTTVANGDTLGQLNFRGADGTNYPNGATITATVDNTVGTGVMPTKLDLKVADHTTGTLTTVLTINSSEQIILTGVSTGTNADTLCLSAGGVVLLQASTCTISSKRFKTDLGAPDINVSASLRQIPLALFSMKAAAEPNSDWNYAQPQFGIYAEDVAAVDPRLALYEQDGKTPKSYRETAILGLLIAGWQYHDAEVITLSATVAQQAATITDLSTRLAALEAKSATP